jgi:starch phosphorylase
MKASLNGVLHLSVLDGWWHESYQGANGWAIDGEIDALDPDQEDEADAGECSKITSRNSIVQLPKLEQGKNVRWL